MRAIWRTISGCLILSGVLSACDEVDDPSVVSRNDLKSPSTLQLIDAGNGVVTLRWQTANYESKFEGYNVYGAKVDSSTLSSWGITNGDPIQLLDDSGAAIEDAKTKLGYFTYRSDNTYALPGSEDNANATASTDEEEDKFSALPYHKLSSASNEPNLPSCKPLSSGTCSGLGTEPEATDSSSITSIGKVDYTLGDGTNNQILEVGQQYCFFVFSVQDGGKEISQSSSNVSCITPKYSLTGLTTQIPVNSGSTRASRPTDLRTIANASDGNSLCSQDSSTLSVTCNNDQYTHDETITATFGSSSVEGVFQFERYSSSAAKISIVSGKNAVIKSMGYFASGFSDQSFLDSISSLTSVGDSFSATAVKQSGGYSNPGQSIILNKNHIYAIAHAPSDSSNPTAAEFYYDWLYISDLTCSSSDACSITYDLLVSKTADVLSR